MIGTDQAFVFLLAWETITVSLYLLAAAGRERPGTLAAAYFGGALLQARRRLHPRRLRAPVRQDGQLRALRLGARAPAGSAAPAASPSSCCSSASARRSACCRSRAACRPSTAPRPARPAATISIAFNAGFYGLWRLVFGTLGPGPAWWGELVIVLGGLGALVGILYAVTQDEIARFLGFSSVEHGGIILLGFGVALLGQAGGEPNLAAAGLLAATLHLVMHGMAKTLALIGADRVADATGSRDLRPLGGLAPQHAADSGRVRARRPHSGGDAAVRRLRQRVVHASRRCCRASGSTRRSRS